MGYLTDIWDVDGLSFYAKAIYCLLGKFADKTGTCFPGLVRLQKLSGLSRPTLIKSIKELELKGHLKVTKTNAGGLKTKNIYYLKNIDKSDVNVIDNDVNDIYNVKTHELNKISGKPNLHRCKGDLRYDVNDVYPNLSNITSPINNNITNDEKSILEYLPKINGYPFDQKKDLHQVQEWLRNYTNYHVLNELEKFNAWWRDNEIRFKGKKNFRSSITNWLKKSKIEHKPSSILSNRLDLD